MLEATKLKVDDKIIFIENKPVKINIKDKFNPVLNTPTKKNLEIFSLIINIFN